VSVIDELEARRRKALDRLARAKARHESTRAARAAAEAATRAALAAEVKSRRSQAADAAKAKPLPLLPD
jgi:hypothetical protein